MPKKFLLIDGHSLLFRAYHGMPMMTNAEGTPTNALYGFLRILFKILDTEKPDLLCVAFDTAAPTFRHKMYDAYKGTRKPAPDDFKVQEPLMRKLLNDMGIPIYSMAGWEADDILGTLAKKAQDLGLEAVIVSGDHDLLQIADDHIRICIPTTKKGQTETEDYYAADVLTAYGVTPKQFIDVKALMGDSSDNIPGLPGVGKVTATKLIQTYGDLENAHAHADEIKPAKAQTAMKENYDLALLSQKLATISLEAPVEIDLEACALKELYTPALYEDFKKLGFKSFFDRFDQKEETFFTYETVRTLSQAEDLKETLLSAPAIGLFLAEEDRLYAAALSTGEKTYAFPVSETLTEDGLLSYLSELLTPGRTVASCRTKSLMKRLGTSVETACFDAVIAAYLLNPLKNDYDYDDIASEHLALTLPSAEELVGKKGLGAADGEKLCQYAAASAYTALAAMPVLKDKLAENGMADLFRDIEMPLVPVLAEMEKNGILCSREALKAYSDSLSGRIDELTANIYAAAGEEFNINSPKQLGVILFEKMQLPGGKKTKTGYSTAADVLEKMAEDQPFVRDILEYRQLTKLKSTYADGLPAFIEEDGRIRTIFHQTITATGRLSSSDPNLQNIPTRDELGRQIRKCFTPAEGCLFVDADYSQIELRILAHMSGDEELIAAYREARDIHRITASQVFGVPFEEVTDEMRRNAKAVNFGIIYGISSFGLSQGLSITQKEAEKYIKDYFAAYPAIHAFLKGLVESAKEKGYAASLFGRRRPMPELKSSNFMQRSFGERVAMNCPIQGTAADIMKIAMIRVHKKLKEEGLRSRLILQIHDELLIEAPKEEADRALALLMEEMKAAADLSVTLETSGSMGENWYEAK